MPWKIGAFWRAAKKYPLQGFCLDLCGIQTFRETFRRAFRALMAAVHLQKVCSQWLGSASSPLVPETIVSFRRGGVGMNHAFNNFAWWLSAPRKPGCKRYTKS
mmetsp:Transcript_10374/g.21600  ORF Transcript_10374/g.21600 Transcript_10374/m.21600 type:complete len:103 (-) Transcript_10374:17-325(-)